MLVSMVRMIACETPMREHIPRLQTYAKKFSPFPQRVALALQAEQASSQGNMANHSQVTHSR